MRSEVVTLVDTPGGFLTPAKTEPAGTTTERDLDTMVEDLLQEVDLTLFKREG